MGVIESLFANTWTIIAVDPTSFLYLTGQRTPDDGTEEDRPPVIGTATSTGSEGPSVQWVAGGARTIKFKASFHSDNLAVDIRPQIEMLHALRARDPVLGRSPRVLFTWGEQSITGFVSAGPVRISNRWITGWPRSATCEITIVEAPEITVQTTSTVTGETQFVTLVSGESFESLGLRYLGNPSRGELIRRENPELLEVTGEHEEGGWRAKVLEREHPRMRARVQPTAVPFVQPRAVTVVTSPATTTTPAALELSQGWQDIVGDLALLRGSDASRGLPWARLPAVVAGLVP